MRIYISGISGTGLAPLALMAADAGFSVCGSDIAAGALAADLSAAGIEAVYGPQKGEFLAACAEQGIDWFVHTSALPTDHPELVLAHKLGLKITKRDALTAELIRRLNLKLIAVAGTHGKTTTASMLVWVAHQLNLPISYIVGTRLGFAPSGHYDPRSEYFIYEADEYDRNFLHFSPHLAVIPHVSYDHPDIYSTATDYLAAFAQFINQSQSVIISHDHLTAISAAAPLRSDLNFISPATVLPSLDNLVCRTNSAYVLPALTSTLLTKTDEYAIIEKLQLFKGVHRRFEQLSPKLYSDYAHHPEEIALTLKNATELAAKSGLKGVVALYEPHQNQRQHEVYKHYPAAFAAAARVLWLPTFLVREPAGTPILSPSVLTADLTVPVEFVRLDASLKSRLASLIADDYLVILMSAGPADSWLRKQHL